MTPTKKKRQNLQDRLDMVIRSMGDGPVFDAMLNRGDMTPFQARVVSIGMTRHEEFDERLDIMWGTEAARGFLSNGYETVVIGAGLHAGILCTIFHKKTGVRPLVLEATDHPGGKFAISRRASFFTNSRNRPGDLPGLPGDLAPLNVLPGFTIQPSMLSLTEFQENTVIAFPIRMALAMHGDVRPYSKVVSVERIYQASPFVRRGRRMVPKVPVNKFRIILDDGRKVYCRRLIDARGLGYAPEKMDSPNITTFLQFMKRMGDETFPLRGLRRVAVVGGGDSARCAIEALCGQGPGGHMSTAHLDWIPVIDWYAGDVPSDCSTFAVTARSRYKQIASLLPRPGARGRVRVINQVAPSTIAGYNCAYVGPTPYDLVIECKGFVDHKRFMNGADDQDLWDGYCADGSLSREGGGSKYRLARVLRDVGDFYAIGSAARLQFDIGDGPLTRQNEENKQAIFRLGARTARFAEILAS